MGELLAWIIGWDLVLEYGFAGSIVAVEWALNLAALLGAVGVQVPPWLIGPVNILAAAIIAVITLILIRGVEESARMNAVMVIVKVGVVLLGCQQRCFTYVSVTPQMGESGLVKLNLHPVDWKHPDDRATYLDALEAEVYAGDPISFAELLRLPTRHRPRALISVSMALSAALRERLEARFACPVLDIYSLNTEPPPLDGVITAVSTKAPLVQISLGSDDGLKSGHTLEVFRGSSYLGRIVIREVSPSQAVGVIVTELQKDNFQKGDRVATKL